MKHQYLTTIQHDTWNRLSQIKDLTQTSYNNLINQGCEKIISEKLEQISKINKQRNSLDNIWTHRWRYDDYVRLTSKVIMFTSRHLNTSNIVILSLGKSRVSEDKIFIHLNIYKYNDYPSCLWFVVIPKYNWKWKSTTPIKYSWKSPVWWVCWTFLLIVS